MQTSTQFVTEQHVELEQTLAHLVQLVHRPSITPNDAGCQQYLMRLFHKWGMEVDCFEIEGVSNLIAKIGNGGTRIAFAGHTDVVPAPYPENWDSDPFSLTIDGEKVVGRGVADMKGGISAMLTAFELALPHLDLDAYSFYFLITSDEEGEAEFGTQEIMEKLELNDEVPHFCIIGEPTSQTQVGDVIKIGRRGSISGEITIHGVQGHVAYPQEANNAAHRAMMLGRWLSDLSWDEGTKDFPGSHLQVTGINTGGWTDNIIPGQCSLKFNIRYSHKQTQDLITKRISDGLMQLKQLTKDIEIEWSRPCLPYFTASDAAPEVAGAIPTNERLEPVKDLDLIAETERSIFNEMKLFPRLSVSGGTSDGRFIAAKGTQVVEIGLPNHSIHKTNEHVSKQDLFDLTKVYKNLLMQLMAK
ncbi:succinyl-diaminopimelate desuccinylase [Psychrosphaera ytuae]|uniref:Succinyl-diaminopimelate desuccinylase n=1 Tax=Psychrosphaera ytuae TaxID=2820710 RepID=A0A975HHF1_9GAMM|nr:succinyl-diaminopimelate desuccinylase [Psychrosphaera ytuae]QTH63045.1 succinyl-diaminopimelate desuccinylase [Psychrosphaera ytuae]